MIIDLNPSERTAVVVALLTHIAVLEDNSRESTYSSIVDKRLRDARAALDKIRNAEAAP